MTTGGAFADSTMAVALKTVTLALGGTIPYFALRAYRRTNVPALRVLVVGFGLVTLGTVLGGLGRAVMRLSVEARPQRGPRPRM
ncbi:hypothetical protein [Halorussus sp. MSC15.2]|uniref:DUF7521 family protein n=1 Tax=Halorussus sp. MSC15.2 TaxID=2283638 RepID=UPI0013D1D980|nr:hypothetical protein [Halorussus sp. MSC15.2]NEU56339.1 hypothetical protein [Halorussus sp. MSC15.2]